MENIIPVFVKVNKNETTNYGSLSSLNGVHGIYNKITI